MVQPNDPTALSHDLIGRLRQAVADNLWEGLRAISYYLPIVPPGSKVPLIFKVHLTPTRRGTFIVTCKELPAIGVHAKDEEAALACAEHAINDALMDLSSPNFSY